MEIHSLLPKYIDQIYEIEVASFSVPWSINSLRDDLENHMAKYFVLTEGEEVLAYLGIRTVLDEIHIMNIAVKPEHRGKGYSTLLMNELDKFAVDGKFYSISLEVREGNEKARNLYNKCGFETCGVRKDYYEKPKENAVLMVKYVK